MSFIKIKQLSITKRNFESEVVRYRSKLKEYRREKNQGGINWCNWLIEITQNGIRELRDEIRKEKAKK